MEVKKNKILVTGGFGQLGRCVHSLCHKSLELDVYYASSEDLDITNKESLTVFFKDKSFDYVINCAAYTNVEQAEKETEKAFLVNADGAKNVAQICKEKDMILIHISTDYVFDGKKREPYLEKDIPSPINEYGKSKLLGEQYIKEFTEKYFIVRTSWLYSEFGKNFYKTIQQKLNTEKKLTITTSETGTPTNANDLALFLITIIKSTSSKYGVYHFSNLGESTWYDFAYEIVKISNKVDMINVEKADNYPTFAERPKYSVLSKKKSIESFGLNILNWDDSLKKLHLNTK